MEAYLLAQLKKKSEVDNAIRETADKVTSRCPVLAALCALRCDARSCTLPCRVHAPWSDLLFSTLR